MTQEGWFNDSLNEHNQKVEKELPEGTYGISKEFIEYKHLFMIQKECFKTKQLYPCKMELTAMRDKIDHLLDINKDTGLIATDAEMLYLSTSFNVFKEQRLTLVMWYAGSPIGNDEALGNMTPDEQELYYTLRGHIEHHRSRSKLRKDDYYARPT